MSPETLSPAGEARREAMLETLLEELKVLHDGRRRRRRALAVAGGGLAVVSAALASWRALEAPAPAPVPRIAARETPLPAPSADVQRVLTEPDILARCRPATTFTAEIIDDEQLIAALHEIHRPAGLIRMNGRARLTAPVADNG